MKAIMIMFDSLNRNYLSPYGCRWTYTPNFMRLAKKSVTFDTCYAGSLPCMPARRELHTGRYNFLHRSWGPMEPFDDSVPEILRTNGVYTHLISDHQHYWEDGGATYHTRYSSWEITRGQEGDPWKSTPELIRLKNQHEGECEKSDRFNEKQYAQDKVNRQFMKREGQLPQKVTFERGIEFIKRNHSADSWFLQIETFDPHEPFVSEPQYKTMYHLDADDTDDWPPYYFTDGNEEKVKHYKNCYAALLSMCDESLGKILDLMDKYSLWDDTMLIVNTDHGFLLGEHSWWGKNIMPVYDEIARLPLFIYDPEAKQENVRRRALVQTIDIPATLLDYFHVPQPRDMQGKSLRPLIRKEQTVRDYALFGFHGAHVNITDGDWIYMKAPMPPKNYDICENLYEYTLMPTHMRKMFAPEEIKDAVLEPPLSFTKGCPVLKMKAQPRTTDASNYGTVLYHITEDPDQKHTVDLPKQEKRMANALIAMLEESDCPDEIYERLGLKKGKEVTDEDISRMHQRETVLKYPNILSTYAWDEEAVNMYRCVMRMVSEDERKIYSDDIEKYFQESKKTRVSVCFMEQWIMCRIPKKQRDSLLYFALLNSRVN